MSDTAATDAIKEAGENGAVPESALPKPEIAPPIQESAPELPGTDLQLLAWKALSVLASLRLTVALFVLELVLVFVGTLALADQGMWTVIEKYFRTFQIIWIPWNVFTPLLTTFFEFPKTMYLAGSFPFPGGFLIGTALLVNLLAAHLTRFKATWKRSGILILHSGLIVLMLGEFIASFQIEASMTIEEGGSSNFVENRRIVELAIIDRSDPKTDDVMVIPGSTLQKGGRIGHDELPFDVEVKKYMINSSLTMTIPDPNPADQGHGLKAAAAAQPEVAGTKSRIDIPAAYVTFKRKGTDESLGSYLVTPNYLLIPLFMNNPEQTVKVGEKTYHVGLRFARTYKPYTVHLIKFRFDRYPGTDTAKNFSSDVRIVDPERNLERRVLISMNDPLRYRGETFYQQSFDEVTEKATVLQVVRNPGWLMPYVACALVCIGMLVHFGLHLTQFLRKVVVS